MDYIKQHTPINIYYNGMFKVLSEDGCRFPVQELQKECKLLTKKFKGAILNGEINMHLQLQVVMFLQLLFNKENVFNKFYVLILCPDDCLSYWHYHLTNKCKFNVKILDEDNIIDENSASPSIYLLKFSLLKLCSELYDFEYFIIIIDHFDEIAPSRPYRKLYGEYKIGLTSRNFYMNPNPKLQYNMLNWTHPGCVGKANNFQADSEVFLNVRDTFRHFWCRITWKFCDSFKEISEEENNMYENDVKQWSKKHELVPDSEEAVEVRKKPRKTSTRKESKSVSTKTLKTDYKPLPTMDETPILTSIINNFNSIPDPERNNLALASTSKSFKEEIGDGDFLKSFILSKPENVDILPSSFGVERFSNEDIEMLLKETDEILN